MKKNVLVFPCGSEVGLEIHRALCFSTHFNLVGASSVEDHGSFVYKNYLEGIPFPDHPDFIAKVNETVKEYQIDFIFPAHDSAVLKLAKAKADGLLDCEVVTSPLETCEIARSKLKTYQFFKKVLATPKIFATANEISNSHFPIFLKPDVGQGSKGTYIAKTLEDVSFYSQRDPSLLFLEYLPGKEYTIDCFTNKSGELLCAEGRERKRISNGISVNSASIQDMRLTSMAQTINQQLTFRGAWFFQVKESQSGELVLMEIAPRIAGTMGLTRCRGINLALLSLFDLLDYDVRVDENDYEMVIDRALQNSYRHNIKYRHVYLDFDDLVIFEGTVNPNIMAFVYQCFNKQVAVHLLTRHKDDLQQTLQKYHLDSVFKSVIHIQDSSEKASYITQKDAIFIDDSFSERQKVHEACHIPVFDSHMVESLMEKY